MKIIVTAMLIFTLSGSMLAADYQRQVKSRIEIQDDGSALLIREEMVPASDLSRVYALHAKEVEANDKVRDNFIDEISKEIYFLYGTMPERESFQIKFDIDAAGNYSSMVEMRAPGLLRREEEDLVLCRKRMEDEGKLSPKLFSKYFEYEIDGRLYETAFLQTEKNLLITERLTEIVLPEDAKIGKITPVFEKAPTEKWTVDFGGGSTCQASLESKGNVLILREKLATSGAAPKNLLDEKNNSAVLEALRHYAAFEIRFASEKIGKELSRPRPHPVKDDFSGSWSYSVSSGERLSKSFSYQTLSVTPGITVTLDFGASLLWEHQWVWSGWSCKYKLKKFQSTLSFNPSLTPYIEVQAGATLSRDWSATLFDRSKAVTFWVSGVPVVIYLKAKLEAQAEASISGSMGYRVESTFGVNTSLTVKYENGWSKSVSVTPIYQSPSFTASAKVNASAEGRLPFTLAAYVYNVAGPFVTLTPWIRGQANAAVGSTNQVGYAVTGGIKANGGIQMAGWLKNLCDNIPSVSYEFYNQSWNLKSGTYTF